MADDDDEYEEGRDGSRLLEFMFGNIDGSGDLDIDYLDEVSILSRYLLVHLIIYLVTHIHQLYSENILLSLQVN